MSKHVQMNITHTGPFRYVEEYKNLYEYTSTKIISLMTYTLVETVGNALWWGIGMGRAPNSRAPSEYEH